MGAPTVSRYGEERGRGLGYPAKILGRQIPAGWTKNRTKPRPTCWAPYPNGRNVRDH